MSEGRANSRFHGMFNCLVITVVMPWRTLAYSETLHCQLELFVFISFHLVYIKQCGRIIMLKKCDVLPPLQKKGVPSTPSKKIKIKTEKATLWARRQTYDFVMGIIIACTFVDIARFPSTDNDLYL